MGACVGPWLCRCEKPVSRDHAKHIDSQSCVNLCLSVLADAIAMFAFHLHRAVFPCEDFENGIRAAQSPLRDTLGIRGFFDVCFADRPGTEHVREKFFRTIAPFSRCLH
jgi:hypothetical protein